MFTKIKTTNFEMTPAIEKYLRKRLKAIEDIVDQMKGKRELWIELARVSEHHQKGAIFEAKLDLILKRKSLRAEATKDDLYSAIDEVRDDMLRELKKYKGKMSAQQRRAARVWKKLTHLSPLVYFKEKGRREREEG